MLNTGTMTKLAQRRTKQTGCNILASLCVFSTECCIWVQCTLGVFGIGVGWGRIDSLDCFLKMNVNGSYFDDVLFANLEEVPSFIHFILSNICSLPHRRH